MRLTRCSLLLAIAMSLACSAVTDSLTLGSRSEGLSEEELRENLILFANQFTAVVESASDDIFEATSSRGTRRRTLLWQISLHTPIQEAAFIHDPHEAFVATLTLVVMMRQYFVDGDGSELFGEQQPIAVKAARTLESAILDIGSEFLDEDQLDDVKRQINELAHRHPIRGRNFAIVSQRLIVEDPVVTTGLGWLIDIPMSPFRALQGVGSTPEAVREFSSTARQIGEIVADLPRQMRWQTELLLYDFEDRQTVEQGLEAWKQVAASAERASVAIEAALAGSNGELDGLRATLAEAQALADSLAPTAADLRAGSEAWKDIVLAPEDDAAEDGRPFDIREWESASREIGVATAELRALIESRDALAAAVDRTGEGGRRLVDHAAWRAVQVFAAMLGMLLAYRVISSRLVVRKGGR